MNKLSCLLVIYCVILSFIVESQGDKSIVVYMKVQSKRNSDIMSVEVNEELFMDILAQVELKNKRTLPVNNINSANDFINMVSGENCKCQCLCCDTTVMTTPTTTATLTTQTTPTTRTTPTTQTTPTTRNTTALFFPSTYLPPTRGSTTQRPSTTTRTYHFVPVTHGFRTWSIPPWVSYSRRSTVKSFTRKPPKYVYYAPKNQLYYPGEEMKVSEPIPVPSQNLEY